MYKKFGKMVAYGAQQDLSRFSDEDLQVTLWYVTRPSLFFKPWVWPHVLSAIILIKAEMEDRKKA